MGALPLPLVFAATLVVVGVAIDVGFRLGRASRARSDDEKEAPVSAIAGTLLVPASGSRSTR